MKIILTIFLSVVIFSYAKDHFWYGQAIDAKEAKKKWGHTAFEKVTFKNGDEKIRASMAFDVVSSQKLYVGKFVSEIRDIFGNPDGFYFSDVYPAYIVQRAHTKGEEVWQIVFLLDQDRKVTKVILHKN